MWSTSCCGKSRVCRSWSLRSALVSEYGTLPIACIDKAGMSARIHHPGTSSPSGNPVKIFGAIPPRLEPFHAPSCVLIEFQAAVFVVDKEDDKMSQRSAVEVSPSTRRSRREDAAMAPESFM